MLNSAPSLTHAIFLLLNMFCLTHSSDFAENPSDPSSKINVFSLGLEMQYLAEYFINLSLEAHGWPKVTMEYALSITANMICQFAI